MPDINNMVKEIEDRAKQLAVDQELMKLKIRYLAWCDMNRYPVQDYILKRLDR